MFLFGGYMKSNSWNGILIAISGLFAIVVLHAAAAIDNENTAITPSSTLYQDDVLFDDVLSDYSKKVEEKNPVPETVERPVRRPKSKGKWIWAKVTAYCPCSICCGAHANGKTSTMVNTKSGRPEDAYGYAVDPRAIPYGKRVYVPGYWESLQRNRNFVPKEQPKVDDTGGAMRQSYENGITHIDCRFVTHKAAKKWGVRRMRVFIYDD